MIIAKTNLKKIPEACNKCKFSHFAKYFDIRYCMLLNDAKCKKIKSNSGNLVYTRLKNCPLIEVNNES